MKLIATPSRLSTPNTANTSCNSPGFVYIEGQEVSLTCEVTYGGSILPRMLWWSSQDLHQSTDETIYDADSDTYTLRSELNQFHIKICVELFISNKKMFNDKYLCCNALIIWLKLFMQVIHLINAL